jgi:pilus assembly protein TadC
MKRGAGSGLRLFLRNVLERNKWKMKHKVHTFLLAAAIVCSTLATDAEAASARLRELGRSRWWRRRWRRALRRMRELVESGAAAPRTEVAGGDRVPTIVA